MKVWYTIGLLGACFLACAQDQPDVCSDTSCADEDSLGKVSLLQSLTIQKVSKQIAEPTPESTNVNFTIKKEDYFCKGSGGNTMALTSDIAKESVQNCANVVHLSPLCSTVFWSQPGHCNCVRKGQTCQELPSKSSNKIYEIHVTRDTQQKPLDEGLEAVIKDKILKEQRAKEKEAAENATKANMLSRPARAPCKGAFEAIECDPGYRLKTSRHAYCAGPFCSPADKDACCQSEIKYESKNGRFGCVGGKLDAANGFEDEESVQERCTELKCAFYVWSNEPHVLQGSAFFCQHDLYDTVINGDEYPLWKVGHPADEE